MTRRRRRQQRCRTLCRLRRLLFLLPPLELLLVFVLFADALHHRGERLRHWCERVRDTLQTGDVPDGRRLEDLFSAFYSKTALAGFFAATLLVEEIVLQMYMTS